MSKLSPKPTDCKPKGSWEDLDRLLQSNFKNTVCGNRPSATIRFSNFDIPKEELESELEKAGYTYEDLNDGHFKIY